MQYPHIFDDAVLDNIKTWVMDDLIKVSCDECDWKQELGGNKATDSEMLKTYATGLLAISLAGYAPLVCVFFFLYSSPPSLYACSLLTSLMTFSGVAKWWKMF